MLFNSLEFIIFFPIVTLLFFALPHQWRWFLLLIASCIFYMFFIPIYILILVVTIVIDYFAGMVIEDAAPKWKRPYLIVSIISNVSILAVFKYFNFIADNVNQIAKLISWNYSIESLMIILPIGLSFHTFQSLSYVIEVYRGNQKAERHFGIYALYVMFYPQLVAGPIERPQNLLHQFHEEHLFNYQDATTGLKLMAWGMFKKVVIADRLALLVNPVYGNAADYSGLMLALATAFFAFQIYCDFSGYSDIAIGSARVMGFKLMNNFDRPYISRSISEFWRRWHISLSTWFRDYVYVSLGGNRLTKWRTSFNLLVTFLLSGLWHGANWTFIVWGGLNGLYLLTSIWISHISEKLQMGKLVTNTVIIKYFSIICTFVLISFSWIFFRAENVAEGLHISKKILCILLDGSVVAHFKHDMARVGLSGRYYIYSLALIVFMEYVHSQAGITRIFINKPLAIRWAFYSGVLLLIVLFGIFEHSKFIYFQF